MPSLNPAGDAHTTAAKRARAVELLATCARLAHGQGFGGNLDGQMVEHVIEPDCFADTIAEAVTRAHHPSARAALGVEQGATTPPPRLPPAAREQVSTATAMCPSAPPDRPGAVAFGIAAGTARQPYVHYLPSTGEVTPELLASTAPAEPMEVFRFAARCATSRCRHFRGERCQLIASIVENVQPGTSTPPRCAVRRTCRWHTEHGNAACIRCPHIVTLTYERAPQSGVSTR